jgi:kynurenine formamidase
MAQHFIDISIPLETGVASDPPVFQPEIEYRKHADTVEELASFFPGLLPSDLPDSEGWAYEWLRVNTHNGTHMDAPWHYHSSQDHALEEGGRPSMTIDQIPLEWCLKPGVKLDFRHIADGVIVTPDDVRRELDRIDHQLQPFDIVLVNTSAGTRYGQPDYVASGCGIGRDATLYLAEAGVRIVGTDAWSWDAPFSHTAKRWEKDKDPSIIWEGHKAGRERGYFQMEKLHNLEALPAKGFTVSCFPVKIKGASAGWVRAVAIIDQLTC